MMRDREAVSNCAISLVPDRASLRLDRRQRWFDASQADGDYCRLDTLWIGFFDLGVLVLSFSLYLFTIQTDMRVPTELEPCVVERIWAANLLVYRRG